MNTSKPNDGSTQHGQSEPDGEFHLVQTEVEGLLYVDVREGEDYDDAWQKLLDHGPDGYQTDYDALERGADYHQFRITVHYEPTD